MTIAINRVADIAKFIAFLAAKAKADFIVAPEIVAELVKRVKEWAINKRVTVGFTMPSNAKLTGCVALGAALGLAVGMALPPVGVLAGGVIGALGGFALAHMTIDIAPVGDDGKFGFTLA